MKRLIFLILTIFLVNNTKAQRLSEEAVFPQFYIQNGDTMGITFSIKQAQKIDNDYDLLYLLKQAKFNYEKLDSASIVVINGLGQQVAELKIKVNKLEDINRQSDLQIANLKEQILKYERDSFFSAMQLAKKDTIINNYKKENRKLKTQRFLGFTIGGGSFLAVIILILTHAKL